MKAFRAFFLKAPKKQTLADTEVLPYGSQCQEESEFGSQRRAGREDCKGAGTGNEVLDLSTSSTACLTATFLPLLLVSLLPTTYR